MARISSIRVRCPSAHEYRRRSRDFVAEILLIRIEPVTRLLGYRDRRSYGCVFEKLTCHSLWNANATVRRSKRWNISLVHGVTAPEEHRVRHPRAIEMGSFRLLVLT